MKISIIIPALNEEKCLPRLLESIKRQNFKDYEIIVADAGSTDSTVKICKKYGAKVVKGGLPGMGRNNGAKAAKGDFLFFLDADVKLPKDFLKNAYNEMQKRYLDIATCDQVPMSDLFIDEVTHNIINLGLRIYQFTDPHAFGLCLFVSRRLFKRAKGFDESIRYCEDSEFVKRASKIRDLRILNSVKIYVSVRRYKKEGRLVLAWKFLCAELYRRFKGEIKEDVKFIKYDFAHYDKKNKNLVNGNLKKLEEKLKMINKDYRVFTQKYLYSDKITTEYKRQLKKLRDRFNKLDTSFRRMLNNE